MARPTQNTRAVCKAAVYEVLIWIPASRIKTESRKQNSETEKFPGEKSNQLRLFNFLRRRGKRRAVGGLGILEDFAFVIAEHHAVGVVAQNVFRD